MSHSSKRSHASDRSKQCYTYKNDEYSISRIFESGSVVHNRQWSYTVGNQASAVELAVAFKAKCTFAVQGDGCCRTLRIVDDTDHIHGELKLFINPGRASVSALPSQLKIEKKVKNLRTAIPLKHKSDSDREEEEAHSQEISKI